MPAKRRPKTKAPTLAERARRVKFLLLDVDGVLTDGSLHFDGEGRETKSFFAWDGLGIRILKDVAGIPTALVSGRASTATESRARDLGIEELHLKVRDKSQALNAILGKYGLQPEEICGMGDDIVDLPILLRVGLPAAPANAHELAKKASVLVTKRPGGNGAVRELVEFLLKSRGQWTQALARYQG